ncbi:MAG: hypothetical protein EZS28_025089, partial [Streblomastix strix]
TRVDQLVGIEDHRVAVVTADYQDQGLSNTCEFSVDIVVFFIFGAGVF